MVRQFQLPTDKLYFNIFFIWLFATVFCFAACHCSTIENSKIDKANLNVSTSPLVASSSNLHETEKETVIDEKQNIEKSSNLALGGLYPFGLGHGGLKSSQLLTLLLLTNGGKHLANNQLLTLLLLLQSTGGLHGLHGFDHLLHPLALGKLGFGKLGGLNPLLALGLTGHLGHFGGLGLGGYNPILLLLLAQALNHKKDDKHDKSYHLMPDYYKMPITHSEAPVEYYHTSSDYKTSDGPSIHLPNHYTFKDHNYPADTYQINQYLNHQHLKQKILNTDLLAKLVQTTTSSPNKVNSKTVSQKSIKLSKLESLKSSNLF